MKEQETLEEAAKNYGWRIKRNPFSDAVKANELAESAANDFIEGANWQSKRMYSEEEVTKLLISCKDRFGGSDLYDYTHDNEVKEWFESYKKK